MKVYDDRPEIVRRDFHNINFASASPEVQKRLLSILKNLNISKEKRKEFHTGMTVYEILEHLAQQGHPQIKYILDLIDEKIRPSKWLLGIGAGILVSFLIYLLTLPTFQFVVVGIKSLLTSVTGIPIIGMVYNFIIFGYYFLDIYLENRQTRFNRWRDIFFLTLGTAGNISAYAVLIATGVVASPVVAGLFVAAAGMDVLKEGFCLVQEYFQYLANPPINEDDQLTLQRANARHVFGFEKRRNALLINLGAALLIAGITAVWCFFPGGLFVTIAAFVAIGVVYLIKYSLLNRNEERLRDTLQRQLVEVEENYYNVGDSSENELEFDEKLQFKSDVPYSPTPVPEPVCDRRDRFKRPKSATVAKRLNFFEQVNKDDQITTATSQSYTTRGVTWTGNLGSSNE